MRDFANPCSVLTKSPLLLRDLELFARAGRRTEFVANLSIPTLDEKAWRATEPHTPHPRKRIEAVAELVRNGIPTGVLIAPLIPGINDDPRRSRSCSACSARRAPRASAGSGCTCAARCGRSGSTGCASTAPTWCRATRRLYARGAYLPTRGVASGCRELARGLGGAAAASRRRRGRGAEEARER